MKASLKNAMLSHLGKFREIVNKQPNNEHDLEMLTKIEWYIRQLEED